jgi:cytoskeleton protein RodZ
MNLMPGAVLRQLRLEKNMSLEDIFEATRIPVVKLHALEQDDYQAFPAEVYLIGTIRSYAKEVGADADNLISLLRDLRSSSTPESQAATVTDSTGSNAPLVEKSRNAISKTPYAAVIAVLAILWVLVSLIFKGSEDTYPTQHADNNEYVDADERSEPERGAALIADQVADALPSNATDMIPDIEQMTSKSENYSVDISEESELGAVDDETNRSAAEFVAANEEFASSQESTLEFVFTDECWLQVRDLNDQILFEDLKQSGDNLRLFGRAPFSIMLGNARAVSLTIDGNPVAVTPRGSSKTLRLTLAAP